MAKSSIKYIKENGVYYTPDNLADTLVSEFSSFSAGDNIKIFDPSFGDGSLLRSARRIFELGGDSVSFHGCDLNPDFSKFDAKFLGNFVEANFFEFGTDLKYDIILSNPPYIRHQNQDDEAIERYRSQHPSLNIVGRASDLWAYFLIKSISHLKEGGSIGAVLPWAFIQADYSTPLRTWLLKQFRHIKLLALNEPYFQLAQERVVLVWLKEFGVENEIIEKAFVKDLEESAVYNRIDKSDWNAKMVSPSSQNTLNSIWGILKGKYNFIRFGQIASPKIGVVTGANSFFIRHKEEWGKIGIGEKDLHPIITTSEELPRLLNGKAIELKKLVRLNKKNEMEYVEYINDGLEDDINERSHSKLREPWFEVKTGRLPDAFFPYRVKEIPFLVPNKWNLQSTNSVHRIYYDKKLSITQKKWLHVSLLSIYGQLSLEVNAKTYGRGMVKIEPGALKNALVFLSNDRVVYPKYNEVNNLIHDGQKHEAVKKATDFINQQLGIDLTLKESVERELHRIRESRMR